METRLGLALAVMLVVASLPASTLVGRAGSASSASCETTVRHDAFRTSAAIETVNSTGEATSTVENTKATVRDTTGFVKIDVANPNGYCVEFVVEVSPEIVEPADLGSVESNSDEYEASWRAAQNLSSGTVYTRVTVTLPAGSNATFAPSDLRVESLAWTGEAKRKSDGLLSDFSVFGSEKLEQRKYSIEAPNSSDSVTVPLRNNGTKIEEWQATYALDGEERPVSQDAAAPVYYSEANGSVTFHFNNDRASVEFVAEPNFIEKTGFSWTSYSAGGETLSEWLPFAIFPVTEVSTP